MNLGGSIEGFIPKPASSTTNKNDMVNTRFALRNAWNNNYIANNSPTACTPFRAINNSGDFVRRAPFSTLTV